MARVCTICTSSHRSRIDAELAGNDSLSAIAKRHRVGRDALRRHRQAHLSPALAKVAIQRVGEASAEAAFDATVDRIEGLVSRLENLLSIAEERKAITGGSNVAREIRQSLELIARLRGELQERPVAVVNVLASPEIVAFTAALARVADRHPEIRAEIVAEFDRVPDIDFPVAAELVE